MWPDRLGLCTFDYIFALLHHIVYVDAQHFLQLERPQMQTTNDLYYPPQYCTDTMHSRVQIMCGCVPPGRNKRPAEKEKMTQGESQRDMLQRWNKMCGEFCFLTVPADFHSSSVRRTSRQEGRRLEARKKGGDVKVREGYLRDRRGVFGVASVIPPELLSNRAIQGLNPVKKACFFFSFSRRVM